LAKILFTSIFLFLLGNVGFAQSDSLKIERISKTKFSYRSIVVVDNKIFALNDIAKLVIWDLDKLDTIHFSHNDNYVHYTAICKDKLNQIYLSTDEGFVYKINPTDLSFSKFLKIKYPIHSICFNSINKIFLIVPNAVYQPEEKRHWDKFSNHAGGIIVHKKKMLFFKKRIYTFFRIPQFTYLDNTDRWWMCSSFGEFGGEAQIFDTRKERIYDNNFDINNGLIFPKSIFEDTIGNIFITSGIQHFGSSGTIIKITSERKITKIYDSKDYIEIPKWNLSTSNDGIFVGPGAYNKDDNCIFFSTNKGFYKALLPSEGKLKNPQLLFSPQLSWDREPLAMGVGMAIKSLEFTIDNKLLFLTSNDGIGIYDGQKLTFLK
jgi:hypothetical protein